MGVSLESWRARIGCFRTAKPKRSSVTKRSKLTHLRYTSSSTSASKSYTTVPNSTTTMTLSILAVVSLMLVIGGIETNPGPGPGDADPKTNMMTNGTPVVILEVCKI